MDKFNLEELIRREIFTLEENGGFTDTNMDYELSVGIKPDQVRDGGYAGWALQPDDHLEGDDSDNNINERKLKVFETVYDNVKNSQIDLSTTIKYINNFVVDKSIKSKEVSELLKHYIITIQNIDDVLKQSSDEINFFGKLIKIQKILKKIGLLKEDLVYYSADKPNKDKYQMGVNEDGTTLYMTKHGARDYDEIPFHLQERIKSWMPKSKQVSVKDKCKLGGNPDGTSVACNQGDINALNIEDINDDDNKKRDKENWINLAESRRPLEKEDYKSIPDSEIREYKSEIKKYLVQYNNKNSFSEEDIYDIIFYYQLLKFNNNVKNIWGDILYDKVLIMINSLLRKRGIIENDSINYSKVKISERKGMLTEEKVKFGSLMLHFNLPNWDNIINKIKEKDLYDDGSGTFGKEDDPHITILYGFHEKVEANDFNDIIENIDDPIEINLKGISLFESEKFDVVKFDVEPDETLLKLRKEVETFPSTLTYKNYHPHMTIAYVKPGEGKKYIKEFDNNVKFVSDTIVFSNKNRHKTKWKLK